MSVRATFRVTKTARSAYGSCVEIDLDPQYDTAIEEDRRFCKATPSGHMKLFVDNPTAIYALELGKYFYVDFTEVPL